MVEPSPSLQLYRINISVSHDYTVAIHFTENCKDFSLKNCCENSCPYVKLSQKSLQLCKEIVVWMENNWMKCAMAFVLFLKYFNTLFFSISLFTTVLSNLAAVWNYFLYNQTSGAAILFIQPCTEWMEMLFTHSLAAIFSDRWDIDRRGR